MRTKIMPVLKLLLLMLILLPTVNCAPTFHYPYTKSDVKNDFGQHRSLALAHYLTQEEADVLLCSSEEGILPLDTFNEDDIKTLLKSFKKSKYSFEPWIGCVKNMLDGLSPAMSDYLLTSFGEFAIDLLEEDDEEPYKLAKLDVIRRIITERNPDVKWTVANRQIFVDEISSLLKKGKLSFNSQEISKKLLEILEIESGFYKSYRVTKGMIQGNKDEKLLKIFCVRLPKEKLRIASKKRLVDLRIDRCPYEEIKDNREQVIARVLEHGRNAITIDDTEAVAIDQSFADEVKSIGVFIRQDVMPQTAVLLGFNEQAGTESIVPTINMHGKLKLKIDRFKLPLNLCTSADKLDPAPCVDATEIKTGNPLAYFDRDGLLHFKEDLGIETIKRMLIKQSDFNLSLAYNERKLIKVKLPLRVEKPKDLIYKGNTSQPGPNLKVRIKKYGNWVMVQSSIKNSSAPISKLVILEAKDAANYKVISKGGTGATGRSGMNGSTGSSGMSGSSAMCPSSSGGHGGNGGRGGNGTNGGPGGPGAKGGNIAGVVVCSRSECAELNHIAKFMLQSLGGDGGPGGRGGKGGRGGRGGSGGSGASCYSQGKSSYLSGGMSGSNGMSGSDGMNGPKGPDGKPGKVKIKLKKKKTRKISKHL